MKLPLLYYSSLHLTCPSQDIIQQSGAQEMQVAQLETAARQMATFAQSNRLKQLASLIVARTSPAEVAPPALPVGFRV